MRKIIYLLSYAETDQASKLRWRKIPTVVVMDLLNLCVTENQHCPAADLSKMGFFFLIFFKLADSISMDTYT